MNRYLFLLLLVFSNANAQKKTFSDSIIIQAKIWNKDSLKNITYSDWKPFKSFTVKMLDGFQEKKVKLSRFGGNAEAKAMASGFFKTTKKGARWWVIDPDGLPFYNLAVNSIRPGSSAANNTFLIEKFGRLDKWQSVTVDSLRSLGFNTSGSWSDTTAIFSYNSNSASPFPYTLQLNLLNSFSQSGVKKEVGTSYPTLAHLFNPAFDAFVKEKLGRIASHNKDPFLFGYFSDNELPFQEDILSKFLAINNQNDGAYVFARAWLASNAPNFSIVTKELKELFSGAVASYYYQHCSDLLKKVDPNHMYLGSRLHSSAKNNPSILAAAEQYLDIISINYYGSWAVSEKNNKQWAALKKPFIITEFYTKAMDANMDNISGAGWIVKTQEERGIHYQNFGLTLLTNKNCVGWHWFRYQDNDPSDNTADPSNKDSNKGVVDTKYNWYAPLSIKMKELNANIYTIIHFLDQSNVPFPR